MFYYKYKDNNYSPIPSAEKTLKQAKEWLVAFIRIKGMDRDINNYSIVSQQQYKQQTRIKLSEKAEVIYQKIIKGICKSKGKKDNQLLKLYGLDGDDSLPYYVVGGSDCGFYNQEGISELLQNDIYLDVFDVSDINNIKRTGTKVVIGEFYPI